MTDTTEVLGSQEWLHDAKNMVWLDTDLLNGDGLIVAVAPQCFTMGSDGLEYVRFGKVRSLEGGAEMRLPVAEHLLGQVLEAAKEHPGECVYIDEIPEGQSSEQAWASFFGNAVREVHDSLKSVGRSLAQEPIKPRLLNRMNRLGTAFTYLTRDSLLDISAQTFSSEWEARRLHAMQGELLYAASLVDPSPQATTMQPTLYDSFDVLKYVNTPGSDDLETRQEVAAELRNLLADDGLYRHGSAMEIEALMVHTRAYFQPAER